MTHTSLRGARTDFADNPSAVCAASKQTGDVVCLTSYGSPRSSIHLFNSTRIWEACRATSAATSFFEPITIGRFEEQFVDAAALGVNNPIYAVWSQAQDIWGAGQLQAKLGCLVSIGTGMPGIRPFRDDVLRITKTMVAIATETEKTAERFRQDKPIVVDNGLYYRFNVGKGLEDVGLQEASKKPEIAACTARYLQLHEVAQQMKSCVSRLSENCEYCPLTAVPAGQEMPFSDEKSPKSERGVPSKFQPAGSASYE